MERDTNRKLEEVLQGNWNNFQSSLQGYMLHKNATKGIRQIWEHFRIHLCIWEEKGEWNQGGQKSPSLIINEDVVAEIHKSEGKAQIIKFQTVFLIICGGL